MTDKEIRLELAKAALMGGASIERIKQMHKWVTEEAKSAVDLDDVKVTDMEQYLGMSAIRFSNRCRENEIYTIGQLVRVGSKSFRALRLVGGGLCEKITAALREHYGVEEW